MFMTQSLNKTSWQIFLLHDFSFGFKASFYNPALSLILLILIKFSSIHKYQQWQARNKLSFCSEKSQCTFEVQNAILLSFQLKLRSQEENWVTSTKLLFSNKQATIDKTWEK